MSARFVRWGSFGRCLLATGILSCACVGVAHAQDTEAEPRFRAFALRLGGNFSPNVGPAFGIDYTVPQWGIGRGFATRFTLEGIWNSREGTLQGAIQPIGIVTIDQVYRKPGGGWRQPYFGFGIGFYSGPFGRQTGGGLFGNTYETSQTFGGKLFLGGDFTSTTGIEGAVHFTENGTLTTVQLRVKL
jgi:hypothetical protein